METKLKDAVQELPKFYSWLFSKPLYAAIYTDENFTLSFAEHSGILVHHGSQTWVCTPIPGLQDLDSGPAVIHRFL